MIPPGMGAPGVTIVIATFNRPRELRATVEQMRTQPFADFELWVIDQSEVGIAAQNAEYVSQTGDTRLHYLRLPLNNLPNARNEGLARARAELVVFVDDDVVLLADNFLGAHVRAFDDPSVGGVTGRHVERRLRANSRRTACHVSWGGRTIFNLSGQERQEVRSCKGSNMSFRMAVVREIGGFDRRTHLLEETDFSTRVRAAGWRILFEPAAELLHLSTPAGGVRDATPLETERRRFRSTAYYVRKHRGWLGLPGFVMTFAIIALLRATELRSLNALPTLCRAIIDGLAEARRGADQSVAPFVAERLA
jgi:GT2 family glycosyltransferase